MNFLKSLLEAAAPSGFESRAAAVWAQEAQTFAERVYRDHYGNVYAEVGPEDAPAVMLSGHLDEIGLMVTHVDDKGLIYVGAIGGWDPQVLVAQRVRLLAEDGDLVGVVGKKPIHLMSASDRDKVSQIDDLWIDVGLEAAEVKRRVRVGTVGVIEQPVLVVGERVMSPSIDNRIGAYVVLEALRKAAGSGRRVVAVASSQEEIGAYGARVAANRLDPVVAIAVDVTFETTQPGVDVKRVGEAPFGSGANLAVSPLLSPKVLRDLIATAERENIPYTLGANPRRTSTDADEIVLAKTGVPGAVVSIPNRYMHSPSEMIDMRDVRACIDLIAAYAGSLEASPDFTR
nr:M42 family metallopeptidase [Deinobacterium chartae]